MNVGGFCCPRLDERSASTVAGGFSRERLRERGGWPKLIDDFWAAGTLPVIKRRKNKPDRVLEAFDHVRGLRAEGDTLVANLARNTDGASVAPELFLRSLLGLDETVRASARVVKTRMEFI